jgi:hypothetical protein
VPVGCTTWDGDGAGGSEAVRALEGDADGDGVMGCEGVDPDRPSTLQSR